MTASDSPIASLMMAAKMPDGLRETYGCLVDEVVELNARWMVFKQLYASGDERIKLFNTTAPALFSMVHDSMRDGIFMSINRLADPLRDRQGNENLTLSRLIDYLQQPDNQSLLTRLKDLLQAIERESTPLRAWRNRRGGHNDLRTSVQYEVHPLPAIKFDSVEDVLRLTAEILNLVRTHFGYERTDFSAVIMLGDGDSIVRCLERAQHDRDS